MCALSASAVKYPVRLSCEVNVMSQVPCLIPHIPYSIHHVPYPMVHVSLKYICIQIYTHIFCMGVRYTFRMSAKIAQCAGAAR